MDLNQMLVFARVVEAGSFVGASRVLSMPKSTVSRKVSELEERLGARLLHRTTRRLSLTDVGQSYYNHAARALAESEEAELAVTRMQDAPRGLLRVTAPLNFGYLAPSVASFMDRFPEVQVEMLCADRVVDLVQEGIDVAIRAGRLPDSSMIARSLGALRQVVVASPGFLKRHGAPARPEDLPGFDCLVFSPGSSPDRWELHDGRRSVSVEVAARLAVNDFDFLDEAVRAGLGIAMLPFFRASDDLQAGRLRRVLPQWCSPETPLHAVYPSTRHLSPKVKAFVDHVRDQVGG